MDVTQALKDAENALRDFLSTILQKELGPNWIDKCGVTSERIEQWKSRRQVEDKRHRAGTIDDRLIYYADFYDLKKILKKNWQGELSEVFKDLKTVQVFLSELEKYRDTDSHRRELLPYQKQLVLGMSGDIRNRIVKYRSKKELSEDYYPRFESVRDSLGNVYIPGKSLGPIETGLCLRSGGVFQASCHHRPI